MATVFSGGTILVSLITLTFFVHSRVATSKVPPSVPWAGLRKGVFSKTRACIRELTAGLRTLKIGYDQVPEVQAPTLNSTDGLGVVQSKRWKYVSSTIAFSNWLGGAAIIIAQMPWILKAFFGYLGALPIYYYRRKAFTFLVPVICDRMANLKRMRDDPSFRFEAPDDLITWATQASIGSPETVATSPEQLAVFMLILSLAAIPTTVLTATNTMLDLVSSDHDAKFWGQLHEEVTEVFKNVDDWTNPASILKLSLADSTIRESLRKNPIIARSVVREVIADNGITLPSGHFIPKGAWMCADAVDLHHDSRFYPKPEIYDPFRFAKKQDNELTEADKEALTEKASIYRKNQALVTTSDIFLSFGYGKHACTPGRWLAAHHLKLMLAYITMNYEIQHMAQRPSNYVLGDAIIPSDTATMIVRRRKHT